MKTVGVVYPYGHAKESEAQADHMNRATMLYLENDTGGSLTSGDVGFVDSDGKVSTTTSQGLQALIVVVATNEDDTAQTIAAGSSGWFQIGQHCPDVAVDGATSIGDWLLTSTTEKKATPDSGSEPATGTFGVAITAAAGAGSVEAVLWQGLGWGGVHAATTSGVHGQVSGSHVVGTKTAAAYRFEGGTKEMGPAGGTCVTDTVTFANAFSATPIVVASWDVSEDAKSAHDIHYEITSISTTGFTIRFCEDGGGAVTATVQWLAYGAG